jgi:hypothetical protein
LFDANEYLKRKVSMAKASYYDSTNWNYRIIKRVIKDNVTFQIHEVYYDKDDRITGWTEEPLLPLGESLSELRNDVFYFMSAFKFPYLIETEKDGKLELVEEQYEKEKITKWHKYEVMDRASVVLLSFSDYIDSHPVVRKNKKLRKISNKIVNKLYKFYARLSKLFF